MLVYTYGIFLNAPIMLSVTSQRGTQSKILCTHFGILKSIFPTRSPLYTAVAVPSIRNTCFGDRFNTLYSKWIHFEVHILCFHTRGSTKPAFLTLNLYIFYKIPKSQFSYREEELLGGLHATTSAYHTPPSDPV